MRDPVLTKKVDSVQRITFLTFIFIHVQHTHTGSRKQREGEERGKDRESDRDKPWVAVDTCEPST